ncbi:MAG: hypothetical protein HC797_03195 [Anaerolineales bacterium]|nr:hypothetical protein [Anaerolineales bacterium]
MNNTKNINLEFVFQIVAILSLGIIYIFQWTAMITNPALRTGADFMAFYSAGRVAQKYGITNTYNISLQQNIQENAVGFSLAEGQVLLYNHLPYLIPILTLIISENYTASFAFWAALMFIVFITSNFIFIKNISKEKNSLILWAGITLFFAFFKACF